MADTREYAIETELGVEYVFDAAEVLDVTTLQGGILVVELNNGGTAAFTPSEYTRWYIREVPCEAT